MPLNFNNNNGSANSYIRYMASTASWSVDGDTIELKQAIFDLDNIRTGWCHIDTGQAPEWVMDHDLSTPAPKPDTDGFKRGFQVDMYSKSTFGDEPVREWGTNSTGAQLGIQDLYTQYEAEVPNNQGKVPVVEYSGGTPTKIGKGNTNVPKLKIVKWVDRPAELDQGAVAVSPSASTAPDDIGDEF